MRGGRANRKLFPFRHLRFRRPKSVYTAAKKTGASLANIGPAALRRLPNRHQVTGATVIGPFGKHHARAAKHNHRPAGTRNFDRQVDLRLPLVEHFQKVLPSVRSHRMATSINRRSRHRLLVLDRVPADDDIPAAANSRSSTISSILSHGCNSPSRSPYEPSFNAAQHSKLPAAKEPT
jgi:hypothetical protein